jgi:hypothetical protein
MDGGVEVGVVGDEDGFEEGRARYGVEDGFGLFAMKGVMGQEFGEGLTELSPCGGAEGHEGVEGWELADVFEFGWEKVCFGAGVQVEEVVADGYAEMLLVFDGEGAVGEVGKGEIRGWIIGFREPALMVRMGWLGHGA